MNTERPCGCKGVRSCLECEQNFNIERQSFKQEYEKLEPWSYCIACGKIYPGWNTTTINAQHTNHDNHSTESLPFPGVFIQPNFLHATEATTLMQHIDNTPWEKSQSGRRKQNFGPKANFKKRKVNAGNFHGFPKYTEFIQRRFSTVDLLNDFQTIEQCSLEYEPTKGAAIDPHIDDCWIWGERVVTVNCLGDAVLTMTLYDDEPAGALMKYNLNLVDDYNDKLLKPLAERDDLQQYSGLVVRIPMPSLSLIVLYGPARYQFEHSVLREDVPKRRVCIAYREFTPMYLPDGCDAQIGAIIIERAKSFWSNDDTCKMGDSNCGVYKAIAVKC